MRIRSIKPEFWRSDDIAALDIADRLLFIGLWSYVDDSGVGIDKLAHICADLFAPDLSENPPEVFGRVHRGLHKLAEQGLIVRYKVENKDYLYITNWKSHQRIDKPSRARFPLPDAENAVTPESLPEPSSTTPEKNPTGTEEQGNRGTGEVKTSSSDADASDPEEPVFSEEVEALCQHLADHITRNGNKTGTIGIRWKQAADRLIRLDGYTPDQIRQVIDWSQQDEFWQGNILSMSKLRDKFDQLKTKMLNERQRAQSNGSDTQHLTTSERRIHTNLKRAQSWTPTVIPEDVFTRKELTA